MAFPYRTTGSLYPSFDPARLVGLTVKHPYAIALPVRLPSVLSEPLKASDTLSEATTPVKLPIKQCPPRGVRLQISKGWYFTGDSPKASALGSTSPTYATHEEPTLTAKLQ